MIILVSIDIPTCFKQYVHSLIPMSSSLDSQHSVFFQQIAIDWSVLRFIVSMDTYVPEYVITGLLGGT